MISRTAVHAITGLAVLAQLPEGQYAGAGEVAQRIGAPHNYLGKLLAALAEKGLVESRKGKGGGFRLARPAETITLFEVINPIDRLDRWWHCFLGGPNCSAESPCPVHAKWGPVRDAYFRFLQQTTIAEIAQKDIIP